MARQVNIDDLGKGDDNLEQIKKNTEMSAEISKKIIGALEKNSERVSSAVTKVGKKRTGLESVGSIFKGFGERMKDLADTQRKKFAWEQEQAEDERLAKKGSVGSLAKISDIAASVKSDISTLGKFLLGAAALIGGAGMLLKGLFDQGEFKGTFKLLGKTLFELGTRTIKKFGSAVVEMFTGFGKKVLSKARPAKLKGLLGNVTKMIAPKLLKTLKFIPLIGTAVGIGFAISRFKVGDWVGGLIELADALVDLIPIPGVGTALSIGINGFLAIRDLKTGGPKTIGDRNKATGNTFSSTIKKATTWIGEKFMKALPYIPVLGNIYEMGLGIKKISDGDVLSGVKDIMFNGLFMFLPPALRRLIAKGFGFMIGWAKEKTETINPDTGNPTNLIDKIKNAFSDIGKKISDWIKSKLPQWALNLPATIEEMFNEKREEVESEGGGPLAVFKVFKKSIKDAVKSMMEKVIEKFTGIFSSITEFFSNIRIPRPNEIWKAWKDPEVDLTDFMFDDTASAINNKESDGGSEIKPSPKEQIRSAKENAMSENNIALSLDRLAAAMEITAENTTVTADSTTAQVIQNAETQALMIKMENNKKSSTTSVGGVSRKQSHDGRE